MRHGLNISISTFKIIFLKPKLKQKSYYTCQETQKPYAQQFREWDAIKINLIQG